MLCLAYNAKVSWLRKLGYARFYQTMRELKEAGLVHTTDYVSVDGKRLLKFQLTNAGLAHLKP